jgi:lipopolysaccharide/colanic/teichoic acid biosynthesis glycosyltransferase
MMNTGWRYRVASLCGVAIISAVTVILANNSAVQAIASMLPLLSRLPPDPPAGAEFLIEVGLTVGIVTGAFIPLYKPTPRRILDIIGLAHKRLFVAVFALATIGYFDYTYKVPRLTLVLVTPLLFVLLPLWFVWLRRPETETERTIIVGDEPARIERTADEYDRPILGYIAPPSRYQSEGDPAGHPIDTLADGGRVSFTQGYLGGLSRFEDAIQEHGVDSAILAFDGVDRAEFFGTLQTCHDNGIAARAHIDHVDSLLITSARGEEPIVDIDLEPWDIQDRMFKRLFDVVFAGSALLVLSPVIVLISLAIKFEGHGPILFSQSRTYQFGDTFTIYKFRTLKPEPDGEVGTTFANDRQTPLGNFLRTTHLDEIPQLWSILVGDMSVVGPRPAQTDLEAGFEDEAATWKQRWFVKPGLTGLAQINDATSQEPAVKIEYDIEYIRRQSLVFDMKIVVRQLWQVARDVVSLGNDGSEK